MTATPPAYTHLKMNRAAQTGSMAGGWRKEKGFLEQLGVVPLNSRVQRTVRPLRARTADDAQGRSSDRMR
jgi:hypothetical protein